MKFEKIRSDLRLMDRVPGNEIGLNDILQLIQDVLLDTIDETGMEFSSFSMKEDDVKSWLSVCRSLSSISADRVMQGGMSDRRKDRVRQTSSKIHEMMDEMSGIEGEINILNTQKKELDAKKESYQTLLDKKAKTEQQVADLKEEIDHLEIKLRSFSDVNTDALQQKKQECEKALREKNTILKEIQQLEDEQSKAEEELSLLKEQNKQLQEKKEATSLELSEINESFSTLQDSILQEEQQQKKLLHDIQDLKEQQREQQQQKRQR